MTTTDDTNYSDRFVCTDCYFAHHYGADCYAVDERGLTWGPFNDDERAQMPDTTFKWFAGESDAPCDREPLGLIDDHVIITDNTDVETGDGYHEFSWFRCEGCGSTLGGSRYRLAIWQ